MGLQTTEEIFDAEPVPMPATQSLENAILEETSHETKTEQPAEKPKKAEKKTAIKAEKKPADPVLTCEDCGKQILGGGKWTAEQVAKAAVEKFGRQLCVDCATKEKERLAAEAAQAEAEQAVADEDLAAQLMAEAEG